MTDSTNHGDGNVPPCPSWCSTCNLDMDGELFHTALPNPTYCDQGFGLTTPMHRRSDEVATSAFMEMSIHRDTVDAVTARHLADAFRALADALDDADREHLR